MIRRLRDLGVLLAVLAAAPTAAAPLTVSKNSQVVPDPQGDLGPKAVPGAEVDHTITIGNPGANNLTTVKFVDNVSGAVN